MDKSPGLFLDRDGVIVENRNSYIRAWKDVAFYPEVLEALSQLSKLNYKIVIITNQSAVGRGIITLQQAENINHRIVQKIELAGGRIDGSFLCPHSPYQNCQCRKPKPGLIYDAAETLAIDLTSSVLVGDALSDIKAGQAAGLSKVILVRTGRGEIQLTLPEAEQLKPFRVFDTLWDAAVEISKI